MDVRKIEDVAPVVEHNGTVPVWWLINPREMKEITDGGYLELANEFEVPGGSYVYPHSHPTHEFYYVTSGRGIDDDRRRGPRDLARATSSTSRPTRCTASSRSATTPRSTASASRSG